MSGPELSLRERKKQQTRRLLWHTAIELFVERGFEQVSVAEIAAAAEVSKMTVFNYFPTKEDLVLSQAEEHVEDPARVVRDRRPGESAVGALRRDYLDRLAARDPSVGLNDNPSTLRVQRLVWTTPALFKRMHDFVARSEESLAAELATLSGEAEPKIVARIAATQIIAVRNVLLVETVGRLVAGESADKIYPEAADNARRAFDSLERGLGGYGRREAPRPGKT